MIQNWHRDEGPCIALGTEGAFDDIHLFGPCVAYEDGVYPMCYSGSRLILDHIESEFVL